MVIRFLNGTRDGLCNSRHDRRDGRCIAGIHFGSASRQRMRFEPQLTGRECRVDTRFAPPRGFIAMTMDLAVMTAT